MVIGAKRLCSCCYLYLLLSCNNLNPKVVGWFQVFILVLTSLSQYCQTFKSIY
jgi:hypothetical protein